MSPLIGAALGALLVAGLIAIAFVWGVEAAILTACVAGLIVCGAIAGALLAEGLT